MSGQTNHEFACFLINQYQTKVRRSIGPLGFPSTTTNPSQPMDAFSFGIAPDDEKPLELIDRADWEKEIEAAKADEPKWDGERVPIRLMVELPFWLLLPDGDVSVSHERTRTLAGICGDYGEVSQGNAFHDSRLTVVYIGPAAPLKSGELPASVIETECPIYRQMKTVVLLRPDALKEAFDAWQRNGSDQPQSESKNQTHQFGPSILLLNGVCSHSLSESSDYLIPLDLL